MHISTLLTPLALLATVTAHGVITKPIPRAVGTASTAACGSAVASKIKADITDHVEGLPEAAAKDSTYKAAACNLWLCRGLQYEDNVANVQKWTVGQKVPIEVNLRIKHKGTANVSIVETKSNKIVGNMLAYWSVYADEKATTTPANETKFEVTVPDLAGKCKVGGECVLQWWWYGTGAKQTYESCLDFTIADAAPVPKLARSRFWNV
ncbi:hypothetical protein B0J14DRAFT_489318 [Halenospora varia]|nr:hypothetical protein B0J14DRAFT_489318 [Halenospora varia]